MWELPLQLPVWPGVLPLNPPVAHQGTQVLLGCCSNISLGGRGGTGGHLRQPASVKQTCSQPQPNKSLTQVPTPTHSPTAQQQQGLWEAGLRAADNPLQGVALSCAPRAGGPFARRSSFSSGAPTGLRGPNSVSLLGPGRPCLQHKSLQLVLGPAHTGGTHAPSLCSHSVRPSLFHRVGTRASGPLRAGQPSLQPQSVVSPTNSFKQALTLPLGRETSLTEAGHSMSRHPQGWRRGHQWEQTVGAAECHLGATSADIITCVRVVVAQESRKGRAPTRAT